VLIVDKNSEASLTVPVFVDQPDLLYQLQLIVKEAKDRPIRIKNRRFAAMKQMMSGDYFSDEQMKERDPLLYEQVGYRN